jgi:hypothetical protein
LWSVTTGPQAKKSPIDRGLQVSEGKERKEKKRKGMKGMREMKGDESDLTHHESMHTISSNEEVCNNREI